MTRYAMIHVSASSGYPEASRPTLFSDRAKAVSAWVNEALEIQGYPDDDPGQEDSQLIRSMAGQFIENIDDDELIWVVGQDGPLDEMATVQLHTVKEQS